MEHPAALIENRVDLLLVVVVSPTCLLRECVSRALTADRGIEILLACATIETAVGAVRARRPHLVLLDAHGPGGIADAERLCAAAPHVRVIAMAFEETHDNIAAWAITGIRGYIPDSASLADFPQLLRRIDRGSREPRMAGGPARRLAAATSDQRHDLPAGQLTPRERLIGQFIGEGMSNKEIARKLDISLGTAKAHVHNLLGKLKLSTRAQVAARLHRSPLRV